jgi:peptidyl-dipeptidase Dcp
MKNKITIALSLALMTGLTACGQSNVDTEATSKMEQAQTKNTVLAKWQGPFEGVPAFDTVKLEDLAPALDIAMTRNLAEIDAIVNNPEAATFENTIVELERAGSDLSRIFAYYGIWRSNKSSPEVRAVSKELSPKLSAFRSKINQNKGLFERIKAVYESEEMKTLRKDQQKMVKESYQGFVRSGALLNDADQ